MTINELNNFTSNEVMSTYNYRLTYAIFQYCTIPYHVMPCHADYIIYHLIPCHILQFNWTICFEEVWRRTNKSIPSDQKLFILKPDNLKEIILSEDLKEV